MCITIQFQTLTLVLLSLRKLQALRAKRDSAPSATTQSVNETRVALDATTKSIETLTSHIQSLEQQHAQVTASIDPAIERQLQQANQQSSKGSSSTDPQVSKRAACNPQRH